MRAAGVSVLVLLAGCGGAPFTEQAGVAEDALGGTDAATDAQPMVEAVRADAGAGPEVSMPANDMGTTVDAGIAFDAGVSDAVAAPPLCHGTCSPPAGSPGQDSPLVDCLGYCTGGCYGTCGSTVVNGEQCAGGGPLSVTSGPGICTGQCSAACIVTGGRMVACIGTCSN